ncbi:sigma-54 interaction domain-containing protein [Limnohabitans lacus]|uniref:Sigma 54-interacting transcriptional regulator n=1 Tax=Limnohabitans lacus TaxID=3045173 RepID=A0ABT6X5M3_9BURK|nr:sigma 54-interacting transcriptional regulator [Limnohabitans sp. HM2-2]MDI9233424.1 sigma 54-interacting transcriptional regulator [Limnohabitans sp. HM2-2]
MPSSPSELLTDLPKDAQSILNLAARSLFDVFANASEGMLLVDRSGRVVWINDQYRRFLPALGFTREEDFVGQTVSAVVQNTLMHQVLATGKPILIDLLTNKAGTFVVSRYPLRDDAGRVIGALGVVLFDQPQSNLQPLMAKFALMQRELDEARDALAVQRRSNAGLRQAKHSFASFVGSSAVVSDLKRQARRAAQSSSPVLLLGETGTGKELLAHAIHAASPRARGPLVSINIAAVPETLLEAEFFGVAPGAYTGADRKGRVGKFKLADGGTLFLDEIGDMPLGLQAKLLRALQENEFEALGSNRLEHFDARVIAATSRDLVQLVREGRFREDLYYRLNVLPLRVPPLRDRASDIPAVLEVMTEELALRNGLPHPEFTPQALALLCAQHWRGNVRELRNVIEQLLLRGEGAVIDDEAAAVVLQASGLAHIEAPHAVSASERAVGVADQQALLRPLNQQVRELEAQAIQAALRATSGNKVAAAKLLDMSRAKLYQRLD